MVITVLSDDDDDDDDSVLSGIVGGTYVVCLFILFGLVFITLITSGGGSDLVIDIQLV